MTTMTLDTSAMRQKIEAAVRASQQAKDAALIGAMESSAAFLIGAWPRDTNSSVVSWQNAANQAGLGPFPVDEIRPSREGAKIEERLVKQLDYWESNVAALEGFAEKRLREGGATGARSIAPRAGESDKSLLRRRAKFRDIPQRWPSYRKSVKQRDRARKHLEQFLEASGKAVAVYGRSRGKHSDYSARTLTSVRTNLGLGEGRRQIVGGALVITLINKSPHARIVESRSRAVARARMHLRASGVSILRREYLKTIIAQSGIASTTARSA